MKRHAVLLTIALAGLVAATASCRNEEANGEAPADSARPAAVMGPADVAVAQRTDLLSGIPVSGTLEPGVDIHITAPRPEVLDVVNAREGEAVRKGQVLARFSTDAVAPAAASAEAQRRIAAADYDRMKNLFTEGAVSQKDVENAELTLRAAEAAAAQATKRLDESSVRAPATGVIAQRVVDSGDRVGDGDLLFRLVNTEVLEFAAAIPSQYVAQVRVGAPVALTVTGVDQAGVSGRVSRVNATVDPATRQVKAYVLVPNPGRRLVGGLFASGRIVLEEARNVIAIPAAGLRSDSTGAFVWTVEDGRLARRTVEAGAYDEIRGLRQITRGLNGGETVVVGPAQGLQDGDLIELVGREG